MSVVPTEETIAAERRIGPYQADGSRLLSFVIPVLNEADSLRRLHEEIRTAVTSLGGRWEGLQYEIWFVDDGSTDESWLVLKALHEGDPRVGAIRFRRNFGKAAALAAGFARARGQRVFTLDADLQDDPAELANFLTALEDGLDVVSGWKKKRLDPWHKTLPSRVFNGMVGWLTGVPLHDHNCGFKLYRREVLPELQLYGEFHRFTPVLAAARGFRIGEIPVNHRKRKHGVSKYGFERFFRGLVDLLTIKFLTSYQNRPQHLLGTVGLAAFAVGLVGMTYLIVLWTLTNVFGHPYGPIGSRPALLLSATSFLFGAQMLSLGLIAELITARNHDAQYVYSLREQLPATLDTQDSERNGDESRDG